MSSASSKALFFDRDGTLIEHKPYLHRPEEVVLLHGTTEALRCAQAANYRFFLFTNQSGINRGYFTMDDVHQVNRRLLELIGLGSDLFTEICIAPESPEMPSAYRKPSPLFITEMLAKYSLDPAGCWMIGDSPSDWKAGLAAKIGSAAVRSGVFSAAAEKVAIDLGVPIFADLPAFIESHLPY